MYAPFDHIHILNKFKRPWNLLREIWQQKAPDRILWGEGLAANPPHAKTTATAMTVRRR
jgi:hypothetical protein